MATATAAHVAASELTAEAILEDYVADFRSDPAASEPITFGVTISGEGGGEWHVVVGGREEGAETAKVELRPGARATSSGMDASWGM